MQNGIDDHLNSWSVGTCARARNTHIRTEWAQTLASELQLQLFALIDVIKRLIDRIKQFPIILVQIQVIKGE